MTGVKKLIAEYEPDCQIILKEWWILEIFFFFGCHWEVTEGFSEKDLCNSQKMT